MMISHNYNSNNNNEDLRFINNTNNPRINQYSSGLKRDVYEWCNFSTTHGLSSIARSRNVYVKILWIIFVCASMSYCIYSIVRATFDYLRHDVYVNYKILQQTPTPFPAISFCNLKSLNKSVALEYIDFILTEADLKNLSDTDHEAPLDKTITQAYLFKASLIINQNLSNVQRRAFGFEIDNMLLSCFFGAKYCYSENFTWFFHNLYGNCFTFNDGLKGDIEKVSIPGYRYGLQLELFVGEPKLQTTYEITDGIIIFVHNQSTPIHMFDHGVTVATDIETNIGIKRTFLNRLPHPHGQCLQDFHTFTSKIYNYIVYQLNVSYSQQLCYTFCIQNVIQNSCNCSNAEMPLFENNYTHMCMNEIDLNCMYDVLGNLNDIMCNIECPLECHTIFYDTSFSTSTYPSFYYKKLLMRNPKLKAANVSQNLVQKSVLKVNIFYENLQYTVIEEVALFTFEAYISSIGGTMGLFLGMSILSLIDVFQFLIRIAFRFLCGYR